MEGGMILARNLNGEAFSERDLINTAGTLARNTKASP
jgi:hypothetical protein